MPTSSPDDTDRRALRSRLGPVLILAVLLLPLPAAAQILPIDYSQHWQPSADVVDVAFTGPGLFTLAGDLPFSQCIEGGGLQVCAESDLVPFQGSQRGRQILLLDGGLRQSATGDPALATGLPATSVLDIIMRQRVSASGGAGGPFIGAVDLAWDGSILLDLVGTADFALFEVLVRLIDPRTGSSFMFLDMGCEASAATQASGMRCKSATPFTRQNVSEVSSTNGFFFDIATSGTFTLPDTQDFFLETVVLSLTSFQTSPDAIFDTDSTQSLQQTLTLFSPNAELLVSVPEPARLLVFGLATWAGWWLRRRRPAHRDRPKG